MNFVKIIVTLPIIALTFAIVVKKFYPSKTWRQILFPLMNNEPESIHEIEYFRSLYKYIEI